ncbi:MAG TPA: hypothetical protein VJ325_05955, partial [Thiobacillus sp.]|nr:hypothetical protein [Thiobacillus sp.]
MNDIPIFDPDTLSHAPVGDLLDLLIEHEDRVPRILFDACVARGEDMVAALADFYARLDADDERDVWWMGLHALFLLGAIPGEAAGRLLIDALRRADREDDLLLDWLAVLVADTSDDPNFRLLAASSLLDFPRQRHRALLMRWPPNRKKTPFSTAHSR